MIARSELGPDPDARAESAAPPKLPGEYLIGCRLPVWVLYIYTNRHFLARMRAFTLCPSCMRDGTTRTWHPFRRSRSARISTSAFADRPLKRHTMIRCAPIRLPKRFASSNIVLRPRSGIRSRASHRMRTWHAHNVILASVVVCIRGRASVAATFMVFARRFSHACILACRSM